MPRTHGYAQRGERCYGTHDWNAKGRINVVAALRKGILFAVDLIKTNVNADIFLKWIQEKLLPALPKNAIVVLDNASFHKRRDIKNVIAQADHTLTFLPPYSPDLNPIEKTWAKLKAKRRKTGASVKDVIHETI